MVEEMFLIDSKCYKTRARQTMEQQMERTRQHAEVFAPFKEIFHRSIITDY